MNTVCHSSDGARVRRLSVLFCAVLLALSTRAFAQGGPDRPASLDFTLDPSTTQIHWTLGATGHTVHGTFKLKSGSFHIDRATGDASGLIVVDATSGESGNSSRDQRMHREVLNSEQYPTVTFRLIHVNGKVDLNAPSPIMVDGILNLHGQDHPLQIAVELHAADRNAGDASVTSKVRFVIPFVAWGLKDPSTFFCLVDRQVALEIDATPTHAPDPSAGASVARPILHPSEIHSAP